MLHVACGPFSSLQITLVGSYLTRGKRAVAMHGRTCPDVHTLGCYKSPNYEVLLYCSRTTAINRSENSPTSPLPVTVCHGSS